MLSAPGYLFYPFPEHPQRVFLAINTWQEMHKKSPKSPLKSSVVSWFANLLVSGSLFGESVCTLTSWTSTEFVLEIREQAKYCGNKDIVPSSWMGETCWYVAVIICCRECCTIDECWCFCGEEEYLVQTVWERTGEASTGSESLSC